jgi:uncharacterized repeat protein (TIGR04138 family)
MNENSLWDAIEAIRETNERYPREAYAFVVGALGVTVQALPAERLDDPERRHLSGQELLRGVIALARREFGVMAPTVFREWRLEAGEDVGQIVFELVRIGQLSARPQDSIDDFRGGPPLLEALDAGLEIGSGRHRSHGAGAGGSPEAAP